MKSPLLAKLLRKPDIAPYKNASDERFKVCNTAHAHKNMTLVKCHLSCQWLQSDFLSYLREWQNEGRLLQGTSRERAKYCLSRETLEGMRLIG